MCSCGDRMERNNSMYNLDTFSCPHCGSFIDQYGVIHYSDEYSREIDGDISVIIPTIKDQVITLDSIPEGVECTMVKTGNVSEARNLGARESNGDVLVFCDDDIRFDWSELEKVIANLKEDEVAGIKGHSLGMLKSRIIIMGKKTFREVNGFDEDMTWMEDTDICLKLEKEGYKFIQLPHSFVEHDPHEKRQGMWGGSAHLYLMKKHRLTYLKKFIAAVFRKAKRTGGDLLGVG
jgi:glycosyltransferase involved in cell wall biosynthesis